MNRPETISHPLSISIVKLVKPHGLGIVAMAGKKWITAPLEGEHMTIGHLDEVIRQTKKPDGSGWSISRQVSSVQNDGSICLGSLTIEKVPQSAKIVLYPSFNYARLVAYYLLGTGSGVMLSNDEAFGYLREHTITPEDLERIGRNETPLPALVAHINRVGTWIPRLPEAMAVSRVGGS